MRVMAGGAVFADRLMLMHKRPALLHMTGVANFIYAIAFHEFGADRAMRIMAIGTAHFALGNRMMRRPVDLRALLLVADEANLGLGSFIAHFVMRAMDFVA